MEEFIAYFLDNAQSIGLLGFFSGFLFIVASVMRPSKKAEMDAHARIPLKEAE